MDFLGIGNVLGKGMDLVGTYMNNSHESEMEKLKGDLQRDLKESDNKKETTLKELEIDGIKATGENEIGKIREQGNIDIEKLKLNNERQSEEEKHKKEMKMIDVNHTENMDIRAKEHEIKVMEQTAQNNQIDAEIKKSLLEAEGRNKRETIQLQADLDIRKIQINATIVKMKKK